jgi:polar amino acid transport system substrate-binding protein
LSRLRTPKVLLVAVLAFAMALTLAGCGSPATQSGSGAETSSTPTASASTSVLDKVIKDGTIKIAVFADVPPMGFMDDKQQLQGIDVDVAKEMAKALGDVKIEFVPTTNANRIPYLQSNKVDIVIASFTMNPERRKVVEYSNAYFRGGAILVVNPGKPASAAIKSIKDCAGKTIAVSKGSFNDELATKLVPNAKEIIRFDNVSDVYTALQSGKADAVVEDVVLAGYVTKNQYPNLKVAGDPLSTDFWGIGARRGDQLWQNWVNGFVFDLLTSGKMEEICAKYGVTYSPVNYVY